MKAVLSNLDLRDHEQGPNMNNMMSSLDDADYAACSLRPEMIVERGQQREGVTILTPAAYWEPTPQLTLSFFLSILLFKCVV